MLRPNDLATAKQRILQHEQITNRRNVRLRRHFNHLVALAGGAGDCSDADYALLEGSVREIKNWLVDNDGKRPPDNYDACTVTGMTRLPSTSCMVSCTIECHGRMARKIFAKRLTDRQMKYYQDHMEWIAPIHAPFHMYADILAMHEYGVPATILPPYLQEEAEAWAIEQVRALHGRGLYHGDLFKSPRKLNLGNVMVKVDNYAIQEVRLIDFGPPHESQSDEDLFRVETEFLRRYDLMKSGDAETIDAKDLAAPPTPMKKKKQPHQFTKKRRRRLSSMMPLEEDDFDVEDIL